jgi:transposase
VPRPWIVALVADRGFARAELLRFIDEQGFGFVIRVKGDARVKSGSFRGKLRDYPLQVGQCFKLRDVTYHKAKQYAPKVVLNCARVKGGVSSWLLATNLGLTARQVVGIYRERFWREESFRDRKQEFELGRVRVEKASRLENLLLALEVVLMMLAVIGMRGGKPDYADKYSARKKKQVVISWTQIALNLLRESSKYLNLLFENKDGCFYFRSA